MDSKNQNNFQELFEVFKKAFADSFSSSNNNSNSIPPKKLYLLLSDFLSSLATQQIFQIILDLIMQAERSLFLNSIDHYDRANGSYQRSLELGSENLSINVPRTRSGNFYPQILPPKYQRAYTEDKFHLVQSLFLSGISISDAKKILKNLGISYNQEILEELFEEIQNYYKGFIEKPLNKDYALLYIDGMQTDVKMPIDKNQTKVVKVVLYVIIGVDMEGTKQVIHFEAIEGEETAEKWKKVLNRLKDRGLERVLLIISDNLSGIEGVISSLFPKADHQFCLVHLMRNIRRNLSKELAKKVNDILKSLKDEDEDVIELKFDKVLELIAKESKSYSERLRRQKDKYLAFKKYPKPIRKYIYSTNPIESLNSIYRSREYKSSGFFNSQRSMIVNIAYETRRINEKWAKNSAPILKAYMHELRIMHKERYKEELAEEMLDGQNY